MIKNKLIALAVVLFITGVTACIAEIISTLFLGGVTMWPGIVFCGFGLVLLVFMGKATYTPIGDDKKEVE